MITPIRPNSKRTRVMSRHSLLGLRYWIKIYLLAPIVLRGLFDLFGASCSLYRLWANYLWSYLQLRRLHSLLLWDLTWSFCSLGWSPTVPHQFPCLSFWISRTVLRLQNQLDLRLQSIEPILTIQLILRCLRSWRVWWCSGGL